MSTITTGQARRRNAARAVTPRFAGTTTGPGALPAQREQYEAMVASARSGRKIGSS